MIYWLTTPHSCYFDTIICIPEVTLSILLLIGTEAVVPLLLAVVIQSRVTLITIFTRHWMERNKCIHKYHSACMNEWMKWILIYRLSSGKWPDLKAVHSTYHRLTDGLPIWVEQSKDTYSWSSSSFLTIIYLGFNHFFFFHLHNACWLSVCDWHSLNTNYYGTTFGGVPGSFNSVPDRMHVWPE